MRNVIWFEQQWRIVSFCTHHSSHPTRHPPQAYVFTMDILTKHLAITMTSKWAQCRLKSPASRLFTQPFIQAQIKENIKAPRHWPLCGEFIGDRWIPRTKGQSRGKYFHFITSSCFPKIMSIRGIGGINFQKCTHGIGSKFDYGTLDLRPRCHPRRYMANIFY